MSRRPAPAALLLALLAGAARGQAAPLPVVESGELPALARGGLPVPLDAGVQNAGQLMVTDGAGREFPAGLRVLARAPGGAARWVLVTLPPTSRAGRDLQLRRRPDGGPPRAPRIPYTGAPPIIDTGALKVVCGDGRPVLLAAARIGATTIPLNVTLRLRDEGGRAFTFRPGPHRVEVHDHAEVRLAWQGALGPTLRATVRATLGKDVPWIQLDVRLENPADPVELATAYLRSLELGCACPPGAQSGFDGFERRGLPFRVEMPASRPPTPSRQRVLRWLVRGGGEPREGLDHPGAIAAGGTAGSLAVALAHAREENPTRFTAGKDGIGVHFLPAGGSGPHYRGRYGEPGRKGRIDPRSLKAYRFEGGRWKTFRVGLLPTIEPPESQRVLQLAHALEHPPLVRTPPALLRASSFLVPRFGEKPRVSDARLRRMLAILVDDAQADPQGRLGRIGLPGFLRRGGTYGGWNPYGWFNHGDVPWAEGYSSLHYDLPRTLWFGWLSSGDRRFADMAGITSAHLRDIDTVHGGRAEKLCGAQRYEKGWWHGNAFGPSTTHQWLTGLFLAHVLTGDPGARRTLDQAGAWLLERKLESWSGLWGARTVGWPIDNLTTLWLLDADPRYARKLRGTIARFIELEQAAGGKGYVLNRGWSLENSRLPARHQSWMQAIVLGSVARYVRVTGDRSPLPLVRRMAEHLVKETYIPPRTVRGRWRPPMVWEFWAPGGYHEKASVHLPWVLMDALARAALVLEDRKLLDVADTIYESVTRFHQWSARRPGASPDHPASYSPISARMTQFPGSESKILGNIGRFGLSYPAIRERLRGQ